MLCLHACRTTGLAVTVPLSGPQPIQRLYLALREAGWPREERRLVTLALHTEPPHPQNPSPAEVALTPHPTGRQYLTVSDQQRTVHIRAGQRTSLTKLEHALGTWQLHPDELRRVLSDAERLNREVPARTRPAAARPVTRTLSKTARQSLQAKTLTWPPKTIPRVLR